MKFYEREKELEILQNQYDEIADSSVMTVVTGRKRIGKTTLSQIFVKDKTHLYLFASKKNEILLCREFVREIEKQLDTRAMGEMRTFQDIFRWIMEIGTQEKLVVIIDEFQNFTQINSGVFAQIRQIWDEVKDSSQVQLIFMGSHYSHMHRIFLDKNESLYGSVDRMIHLNAFSPSVIRDILVEKRHFTAENLFMAYIITGGVPGYLEVLFDNRLFTREDILSFYFELDSPFIEEGRILLIQEFGREYGTYFSILDLLAEGKTGRGEIESILGKDIGGYLEKLISYYNLVEKIKPVGAPPHGRLQKYCLKDNFLKFWFRFVCRNRTAIESYDIRHIKKILDRDLESYGRSLLVEMYHDIFQDTGEYNEIGRYWEKGNRNEINLVCVDEQSRKILICDIDGYSAGLKEKSSRLLEKFPYFKVTYLELSLDDLDTILEDEAV